MLLLFILLFLICCSMISFCYSYNHSNIIFGVNKKYLCRILWGLCIVCMMFISANRATLGLVFNTHAPDVGFIYTINSDYLMFFISNLIYAILIFGVYLFLNRKCKIASPWFLIGLLIMCIIIYYPGVPGGDASNSYQQYLTHSYSDWQPPIFTIWWNLLHFEGATFLMNMLIYYGSLIYISHYLYINNKRWQNDLLIMFSFNPLFFTQLAIILKDVSFTGFLIASVAIYLAILSVKSKISHILLWALYGLCLFFVISFRVNGVFAAFPLIILGMYSLCIKSKINKYMLTILLSVITIIIFFLINSLLVYKVFDAKKTYSPSFVMLTDAAYLECINNHTYIPQVFINNSYDEENARDTLCNQALNYYNSDAIYNDWNNWGVPYKAIIHTAATNSEFQLAKHLWLKALKDNPWSYLRYRGEYFTNDLFFQYWDPTGDANQAQNILNSIAQYQHRDMKFIMSLFMIGATLGALVFCIRSRKYNIAFFIILSSIFQLFGWYFLIPAHAARYFLWNDIGAVLAIILI